MMRKLLAAVAVCSGLVACGDGSGDPNGTTATKADLVKAQHDLTCQYFVCIYGFSPSEPCPMSAEDDATLQKALDAGRLAFDATKAKACMDAVKGFQGTSCWGAGANAGYQKLGEALDTCDGAAKGTVAVGGACYDNSECADGLCDTSKNACPGKCVAKGAAGADCQRDSQCAAGLECLTDDNGDDKCTMVMKEGEACSATMACASDLKCVNAKCAKATPAGIGQECTYDSDCADDAMCAYSDPDAETGVCQAKVPAGGACQSGGQLFFITSPECVGNQVCLGLIVDEQGDVTKPGKCATPADVGGTCDPSAAESAAGADGCYLGLVCDPATSKCAKKPAIGQPCIAQQCGDGAYCANGTCTKYKAPGETCQSYDECEFDCDSDTHKCTAETPDATCHP